jgi:hypothetical protein
VRDDLARGGCLLQILAVVDAEGREGDLRQERYVRVAQLELDGSLVGRPDLAQVAGVALGLAVCRPVGRVRRDLATG